MIAVHAIVFTETAQADLERIRAHIGLENPAAARRVALQIVAACDRLEYFPKRGRPGRQQGTRKLTAMRSYVIVYRIEATAVVILRLWHGAQDRGRPGPSHPA